MLKDQLEATEILKSLNQFKSESQLLTLKDVCSFLNIKESHLRSLVFKRKIPFSKVGGNLRFNKEVINEWLTCS